MIEIKKKKREEIPKDEFNVFEKFLKSVGMQYVLFIVKAITYQDMIDELDYWVSFAGIQFEEKSISKECCLEIMRICTCIIKDMNKREVLIIK